MANFTIAEMVQSNTADRLKISNNPPTNVRVHLTETITLLECIRAEWEEYCERHDLGTPAIRIEFEKFFATEFSHMGYAFDQIIIEKSKTSRWVHVGYKRADGKQRRQCFTLKV